MNTAEMHIKSIGLDYILMNSNSSIEGIINIKKAYNINILSRDDLPINKFHFEDNNIEKNFYVNSKTEPNTIFESLMLCVYYNNAHLMIDIDDSIYESYKDSTEIIIKSCEHLDFIQSIIN